jgi:hypothetical protein
MVQLGSESEPWFGVAFHPGSFWSGTLLAPLVVSSNLVNGEKQKIVVNQQQQPLLLGVVPNDLRFGQ